MRKTIILSVLIPIILSCQNNRLDYYEREVTTFLIRNQKNNNFKLVLDTISSFKWDEMIVIGPYTDLENISNYNLNNFPNTIKSHDSFVLFGFIRNKKGVKYFEIKHSLTSNNVYKSAGTAVNYRIYPKSDSNLSILK